jgi:L-lactate dehydrogenase
MYSKVAIIGAGNVGATTAFALLMDGVAQHIALVDIHQEKVEGEAMDLEDGMQFVPGAEITYGTSYDLVEGADVIVITAGAAQKPGQTRRELVDVNTKIITEIVTKACAVAPEAILLMVTNPVDVLTTVAQKVSGLPAHRVFGSGTILDTARFRAHLGQYYGVHPHTIHAYILGEHGDSEFPAWSSVTMGGLRLQDHPKWNDAAMDEIVEKTRNAAYEIIARKGATYYAIALSVARIVRSILTDRRSILPLSVVLQDYYGVSGLAVSVPVVIGRDGAHVDFQTSLSAEEQKKLQQSAEVVRGLL